MKKLNYVFAIVLWLIACNVGLSFTIVSLDLTAEERISPISGKPSIFISWTSPDNWQNNYHFKLQRFNAQTRELGKVWSFTSPNFAGTFDDGNGASKDQAYLYRLTLLAGNGTNDDEIVHEDIVFSFGCAPNVNYSPLTEDTFIIKASSSTATSGTISCQRVSINSGEVNFIASSEIKLTAPTYLLQGVLFTARIQPCQLNSGRVMANAQQPDLGKSIAVLSSENELNDSQPSIEIYPNPVNDNLIIDYKHALKRDAQLQIFDTMSNRVYSQNVNAGEAKTNIAIGDILKKGIYYLQILNGDHLATYRISIE